MGCCPHRLCSYGSLLDSAGEFHILSSPDRRKLGLNGKMTIVMI